jgi:hypothetical protein
LDKYARAVFLSTIPKRAAVAERPPVLVTPEGISNLGPWIARRAEKGVNDLGRKGAPPWEAVASLAALCAFEAQKQSAKLSQSARLELEHINFPTSEVLKWLDLQ